MAKRKRWESAYLNNQAYMYYKNELTNLSLNCFEWSLPLSCDPRFLEVTIQGDGQALFFYDDFAESFLTLPVNLTGKWNIYNIPVLRKAWANNGYHKTLTPENSVVVFNNYLKQSTIPIINYFAKKLAEIDRAIDVNVSGQRTPILISATEEQRLSLKNLYMQYDGNEPFIFGDKSLDINDIKAINTQTPYVSDKLTILKHNIYNQFLTYIGIENSNEDKKERLVTSEVGSNYGSVEAHRTIGLTMRQMACKEINEKFYDLLDDPVEVNFRSKIPTMLNGAYLTDQGGGGNPNEQIYDASEMDN